MRSTYTLVFLTKTLDLNEQQQQSMARVLDAIDTERAQAQVDHKRTLAAFADALAAAAFDRGQASAGVTLREKSEARLRDSVLQTLVDTHGVLLPAQRERLATMLRTGELTI